MKTTSLTDIESGLANKATEGIDRASSRAHKVVDRFADAASSATEQFDKKTRKFASAGDRWIGGSQDYVRRHPFATIGIAVAVGMLLGRMKRPTN